MFIIKNADIIEEAANNDAIVCSCNPAMVSAGGVCGRIHRAAGPSLGLYLKRHHSLGCQVGEVAVTTGYNIQPELTVLHTVAPRYEVYGQNLALELLDLCYNNVFKAASQLETTRVAVPSLGTGIYRFPVEDAAEVFADVVEAYPDLWITLLVREQEHERIFREVCAPLVATPDEWGAERAGVVDGVC